MEVKVEYKDGLCRDFIRAGKKEEVFRTIMPLYIVTEIGHESDKKRISIISGCSHWWNCENKDCAFSKFSKAAGEARKKESISKK